MYHIVEMNLHKFYNRRYCTMFFDLITIWSYNNRMVLGTSVSCGCFHIKGVYEFPMIATCVLIIDMRFLNNILMYFIV